MADRDLGHVLAAREAALGDELVERLQALGQDSSLEAAINSLRGGKK